MLVTSRKSYWNCAHNPIIDIAISNDRLLQKGLVFPLRPSLKSTYEYKLNLRIPLGVQWY